MKPVRHKCLQGDSVQHFIWKVERVGRNHLIAPPSESVSLQHAKLSSRICPWRMLVLHGKSPRSSQLVF